VAQPRVYTLILLCALCGTLAYKLRFEGIFACSADGYVPNRYLADCQAKEYGDYDHGALWFGLEPQTLRAAAEAQVLFIGSSRLQLALSNEATSRWFAARAVRYFLLGFSHSETTVFAQPLLSKIRPQAKVYVINVDRFFDDRKSPPTEAILRGGDSRARYKEKRSWQTLHRPICAVLSPLCGENLAVFRSKLTGAWTLSGKAPSDSKAVSDGPASNPERWTHFASLGESFLSHLPIDRHCVLLTIVPTVATKNAEATAIASALGIELISPRLDDLRTFDGSHLDASSAERWSAAFFDAAGPRIRKCLEM
jgi:hypothetical protein